MKESDYMLYSIRGSIKLGHLSIYSLSHKIDILNRGVTELRGDQRYEWADETDIYASFEEYKI